MILSSSNQKHIRNLKVKIGHGGTLDPLATGVLIIGVGRGTKCLQRFLDCTKTYECVVLFGAATDSYDAVGKVVSRAPYEHVTKELVEEKLGQFRGKIMQKPSIFSALKVDGKKMYEYARKGGEVPEVKARPVEVLELELVEWLEPGSHEFAWPKEELDRDQREGAENLLRQNKTGGTETQKGRKRSRTPGEEIGEPVANEESQPKKPKTDDEPAMSGALPAKEEQPVPQETEEPQADAPISQPEEPTSQAPNPLPPAARIRMTVTSGFYVRSLCHDLGLACSSMGLMSSLVRSRQGDYALSAGNVVEHSDLEKGPAVWEPQVKKQLEEFMEKEGWEAEEVEREEAWQAQRKEKSEGKRERDRERSFQGGRKGGVGWNDRARNKYSKNMGGGGRQRERRNED